MTETKTCSAHLLNKLNVLTYERLKLHKVCRRNSFAEMYRTLMASGDVQQKRSQKVKDAKPEKTVRVLRRNRSSYLVQAVKHVDAVLVPAEDPTFFEEAAEQTELSICRAVRSDRTGAREQLKLRYLRWTEALVRPQKDVRIRTTTTSKFSSVPVKLTIASSFSKDILLTDKRAQGKTHYCPFCLGRWAF